MVKVSVIIPAYNVAQFISQCLDCVLANKTTMQIIVVDDRSTDNTREIVQLYQQKHKNIELLVQERNGGPGIARNAALLRAHGEYIYFLDADDVLRWGALDELVEIMDVTGVSTLTFKYQLMANESGVLDDMEPRDRSIWNSVLSGRDFTRVNLDASGQFLMTINFPWNKIMRRDFCERIKLSFSTCRVNEDILAHWNIYLNAGDFMVLDRPLVAHRVFPGREQHTNIFDERRLDVFAALRDADNLFAAMPDAKAKYYHWFLCFKIDLLQWLFPRLQVQLRDQFLGLLALSFADFDEKCFHAVYEKMRDTALQAYRLKYAPHKLVM